MPLATQREGKNDVVVLRIWGSAGKRDRQHQNKNRDKIVFYLPVWYPLCHALPLPIDGERCGYITLSLGNNRKYRNPSYNDFVNLL